LYKHIPPTSLGSGTESLAKMFKDRCPVALARNVNRRRCDRAMLASMTAQVRQLSRPH
jgi:hypothetical protein